eukprot:1336610-Rhodomonas_salina.13
MAWFSMFPLVCSATCLRTCYAMSGTTVHHGVEMVLTELYGTTRNCGGNGCKRSGQGSWAW